MQATRRTPHATRRTPQPPHPLHCVLQQARAGYSSAVKQWTAGEDEVIKEGKRQHLSWSRIVEGLTGRSVQAARMRYKRNLEEHASVPAATPVFVRTAAPAASSATRMHRPRRLPPSTAPAMRPIAPTLEAVSDSDSDDGGGPSLPPPVSNGGPHVSAQAAAFENSRQQREHERAGAAEKFVAEPRVAEQRMAERAAERAARDAEMPAVDLLGQSNEMASFLQEGGGTPGDDAPTYRSSAATVGPSDDEEDGDDDDGSMAGSEATNDQDPGYAADRYGADTDDMVGIEDMED